MDDARWPGSRHWLQTWTALDGTRIALRPVRPQDASDLGTLISALAPQTRRRRFHGAINGASAAWIGRMVDPDPHRELALVVEVGMPGAGQLVAEARWARCDTDEAEFALVVDDAWQRQGIGRRALIALLASAGERGLRWMRGDVLADNLPMLSLAHRLGFDLGHADDGCTRIGRRLRSARSAGGVATRRTWLERLTGLAM
ncbi:GNAT family N-acetyltransferase [Roseateles cellulosilyticus]|uniref:GNAT family N-acetyltransferase n=1 Tax=Pelomonas cellulosilytica TaxID=2906762 RepID=A0ABS8XWN5_9BURK|nr:GNAT family N-acetyltransferase [Pelomonas sp. P8]MCE4557072.1 GNAT family N-acetyltransferase [Pelomonas sp. P8]